MRIPSGVTDQVVSFVAVDATDFTTRETGLTTFTVYRCRNGGTVTAMTTPTVTELDATNMPGVYTLLLDEDMTIGAGNDSEEMVFHITATGMAPVTRTIELYRPKFTVGATLALTDINAECDTAISDAALATAANLATVDTNVDAILVDTGTTIPGTLSTIDGKVDTVDTVVDGIQTDLSNGTDGLGAIKGAVDGLNDLSAADVNTQVDTALADYDGPTKAEMDSAFTEIKGATFSGATDSLEAIRDRGDAAWTTGAGGSSPSAADIRAEIDSNSTQLAAIVADTNELQTNQGDWATATGFATSGALATVDTNVDAILVDTGTTIPAQITALNDLSAAQVNAEVDTALTDYDAPTKAELDAGLAALNDLDAAGVRTAVGLATANLDTQLTTIDTNVDSVLVDSGTTIPAQIAGLNDLSSADVATELATYDGPTNTEMVAAFTEIKGATFSGTTDSLEAIRDRGDTAWTTGAGGSAPTVGEIADAVWTEALADHSATVGSTAEALDTATSGGGLDAAGVRAAVGLTTANLDTQLGAIDTNVDAVLVDTGTTIPGVLASFNDLSESDVRSAVGMATANLDTQLSAIDTNVDSILVDTGTTLPASISGLNNISESGIRTALGLASANLDTQLDALPTAVENADAMLNRDMSAVTVTNSRSPINAFRALRNRVAVVAGVGTVYAEDDTTSAWTTTITTDAAADNITQSDPT